MQPRIDGQGSVQIRVLAEAGEAREKVRLPTVLGLDSVTYALHPGLDTLDAFRRADDP